jgi:hypothetical protein
MELVDLILILILSVCKEDSWVMAVRSRTYHVKHLDEEIAQSRIEKDNSEIDLVRYKEGLEHSRAQLAESEIQLSEFKLQLPSSRKSYSLTGGTTKMYDRIL